MPEPEKTALVQLVEDEINKVLDSIAEESVDPPAGNTGDTSDATTHDSDNGRTILDDFMDGLVDPVEPKVFFHILSYCFIHLNK
jgi:hypothetical protein